MYVECSQHVVLIARYICVFGNLFFSQSPVHYFTTTKRVIILPEIMNANYSQLYIL